MKLLEAILYFLAAFLLIVILFFRCTEAPDPGPAPNPNVCIEKLDSLNNFWMDVIKALEFEDTITVEVIDTSIVVVYDTTNLVVYDTTEIIKYIEKDTLIEIDTFYNSFGSVMEITIDSVRVDSFAGCGPGSNMIDDIPFVTRENRGTRWCVSGYPHQAMFYFDTTYIVTEIWINTFAWNENYTQKLELYHYDALIDSIETKPELYSKHEIFFVGKHLYINVVGGRNSYTDLGEVKLFGYRKE